jgi:uncharacterized integral membrane protein
MSYIRYTFWGLVAVALVVVGLANREPTQLRAMPDQLATFLGLSPTIELPLFVVLFLGVALGLIIGFLWEWLREHHIRSEARSKSRELERLRREVDRLKDEKHEGQDEVLALLDKAS